MTRRGSLAYYLVAWICGCFFVSMAVWLKDLVRPGYVNAFLNLRSAFGLLFLCFFALVLGFFSSLAGAFLLRRIAVWQRWVQAWQWMLAGAVLAPAVIGPLGWLQRNADEHHRQLPRVISMVAYGPAVVFDAGLWLAVPAGALTAWVLYRVYLAFEVREYAESPPAGNNTKV
jgi:hypothetical protein